MGRSFAARDLPSAFPWLVSLTDRGLFADEQLLVIAEQFRKARGLVHGAAIAFVFQAAASGRAQRRPSGDPIAVLCAGSRRSP